VFKLLEEVEEDSTLSENEENTQVTEKTKSDNKGVEERLSALEKAVEDLKKTLEELKRKKPKDEAKYPYPTKYPYPSKKSEDDEDKIKSEFTDALKSIKEFSEKLEVIDKRLEKIENTPIEITNTQKELTLNKYTDIKSPSIRVDGGIVQEA